MESAAARRGRPPRLAMPELRARALDVVARRGYTAMTMADIAAEIGLSVRTLHRYFPTKADIVWGGIDRSFDALQTAFGRLEPGLPLIEALIAAVAATFDLGEEELDVSRARLRIIASTPELQQVQSEAFVGWRRQIVAYIAERTGASPAELGPLAAGAAVQTAIMSALEVWASSDGGSPGKAVAAGLRGLALLGSA